MKLGALLVPGGDRLEAVGLAIARVATGLLLAPHGWMKVTGGVSGLAGGLAAKGLPAPTLLAWCAALAELVGGLLLALGLFARPAAIAVAATMTVAWLTMHTGDIANIGTGKGPAFEYPFLLSLIAIAIAIAGPGRWSLDARLFGARR